MRPLRSARSAAAAALLLVLLVITSCARGNYPLPDRNSEETREAERRITAILEAEDQIAGADPSCDVRYLGSEDGAMFAWAVCSGSYDHEHQSAHASVSTVFRVVGDHAEWPRDSNYVGDVEDMLPRRLADDVLNNPNRLKP